MHFYALTRQLAHIGFGAICGALVATETACADLGTSYG